MRGYMFRNRWGALLFVGLTLAGVTTLVGTDEHGAIQQAASQIAQQKAQADKLVAGAPEIAEPASGAPVTDVPFAADEDLIDPAMGIDPTPIDETAPIDPNDPDALAQEVIIVSRDVPGQGPPVAPAAVEP